MPAKPPQPDSFFSVLRDDLCRHISGDPKINPTFCGNERKGSNPYCAEHCALCYLQFEKPKKKIKPPYETGVFYG